MKDFAPTEESYGFSHDLLWSGCRATQSRRSQSESAKLSGATGLPAVFMEGLVVKLHQHHRQGVVCIPLSQQPGIGSDIAC